MPSMLTSVAKSVDHVKVEACPATMVFGLAVSIALGAGAGGGGTGVGAGGFFFEHAATMSTNAKAEMILIHCKRVDFNVVSPSREHSHHFVTQAEGAPSATLGEKAPNRDVPLSDAGLYGQLYRVLTNDYPT